jgi:hypothetical protein
MPISGEAMARFIWIPHPFTPLLTDPLGRTSKNPASHFEKNQSLAPWGMHTAMNLYIYTYIHTYIHIYKYIYMCVYIFICMYM